MKLRTFLASSAAFAAIAIIVPVTAPTSWNPVTAAEAATSISFSVFYDGLADHGDWVSYNDAYVFVPVNTRRDWRPYTDGHWIYARDYGWTWVSDEPFGWATYHYGRWGFAEEIGWYWVPGAKWGPAWVSWRRSGDHVAWAPLPPRRGGGDVDVNININIGANDIPDYYWVACPTRSFLEVNLAVVIIDDDRERRRIVNDTEFVGSVEIENNIVVNNAIEINYIEENSDKKVEKVEIKKTDDAGSVKGEKGEVIAYTGEIEAEAEAKPPKITKVEDIKPSDGQAAETSEDASDGDTKKVMPEQAEGEATDDPAVDQAAKPDDKKKKKVTPEQAEGQPVEAPVVDQAAKPDDKKKKKLMPEQAEGAAADDMPVGSITKPEQKADKKQPDEEPAAKKDKKAVPCDPATDSDCVQQ